MKVINITNQLYPTNKLIPLEINAVQYLVLHHAEANGTWQDINVWHKNNGWSAGGYNEYITKDGTVYIMRGDTIGAHCKGFNSISYGICCEGNYKIETQMPSIQFNALVNRIKFNSNRFKNLKAIVPHSRLYNTECAGVYFPYEKIIQIISQPSNSSKSSDDLLFEKAVYNKKIITTPEYWINNCQKGKKLNGQWVHDIILNFVAMFKIYNSYNEVVNYLKDNGIISSPEYWLSNAISSGQVDGYYCRLLLIGMGKKL
jgi:hypothetical protein